jgi:hypothetical protein
MYPSRIGYTVATTFTLYMLVQCTSRMILTIRPRILCLSTTMSDWRFLDEWFRTLKGAVRIDDPSPWVAGNDTVRLGRDDDELWIEVRIHDGKASDAA